MQYWPTPNGYKQPNKEVGTGTVLKEEQGSNEDFDVYSGFDQIEDEYNKPQVEETPVETVAEVEEEIDTPITQGSVTEPIGKETVIDEGVDSIVKTLGLDSTKQIVDSKDFQWNEVLDPESEDFRRKQRRDFWTTFLATGSTGDAFKASYGQEEAARERYIRNQNKQGLLDQGYTAESVQAYVMSGNQKDLNKHEELELNEALHSDGKVYMTDKYGRPYGLPIRKGKQDVQIIKNPDGSSSSYTRDPVTGRAVLKRLNEPVEIMTKEQAKLAAEQKKQEDSVKADAAVLYSKAGDQIMVIDRMLGNTSGLTSATGFLDSMFPTTLEATSKFEADHRMLQSQQFMTNIEGLKGMGALSDAEGKKIADLVGSLELGMNQNAYTQVLNEIRETMVKAQQRAQWVEQSGRKPTIAEMDQLDRKALEAKYSVPASREELLNKY